MKRKTTRKRKPRMPRKVWPHIVNQTHYRTDDLRRFFRAGILEAGAGLRKRIFVGYSRDNVCRGRATIGKEVTSDIFFEGENIDMYIPKDPYHLNLLDVAQVFIHEVGHNLGLRHREMASVFDIECRFHEGRTIRLKTEPKKPTTQDKMKQRALNAQAKVKELTTKLKRTQTLLKKWKVKVRYYERKGVL